MLRVAVSVVSCVVVELLLLLLLSLWSCGGVELWRCCGVVEVLWSCGGGVELWRWC